MSSILLTAPAAEPLTLAEAKAYLRVEHADDDVLIATLVAGARIHVESETRRALITQTWWIVRDQWPADGRLDIVPAPLRNIVAARVYDSAGEAHALDTSAFVLDKAAAPALVAVSPWSAPRPGRAWAGVEVDVEVGYGDAGADVPEPLRQAIRFLVAHWYENRGLAAVGGAVLPVTVAAAIAPFRVLSL